MPKDSAPLTPREQEIYNKLLGGSTPKEIAFNLNVTYDTVIAHQKSMYRKLGVHSIQELFSVNLKGELPTKKISAANPMVITLSNNAPWGWQGKYHQNPPFYGSKIKTGDRFALKCTYTSNVDICRIVVLLVDNMIKEEGYWTELSDYYVLRRDIKPNIEYTDAITIFATKSASTTNFQSNVFCINAPEETKEQPILTFTRLEIIKN